MDELIKLLILSIKKSKFRQFSINKQQLSIAASYLVEQQLKLDLQAYSQNKTLKHKHNNCIAIDFFRETEVTTKLG